MHDANLNLLGEKLPPVHLLLALLNVGIHLFYTEYL
jgi:hypothetical protein